MKGTREQQGFSLVEVVVLVAFFSVSTSLLVPSISQLVLQTQTSRNIITANQYVTLAALWLNRDARQTQGVDMIDGDPPVISVTMTWIGTDEQPHTAIYQLSGTDLQRVYDGQTTVAARYITQVGFSLCGNRLMADVTASLPGALGATRRYIYSFIMPGVGGTTCPAGPPVVGPQPS